MDFLWGAGESGVATKLQNSVPTHVALGGQGIPSRLVVRRVEACTMRFPNCRGPSPQAIYLQPVVTSDNVPFRT
jgi:hypothetical protein